MIVDVAIGPATLTIEQVIDAAAKATSVAVTLGSPKGNPNPLTTHERLKAFLRKD